VNLEGWGDLVETPCQQGCRSIPFEDQNSRGEATKQGIIPTQMAVQAQVKAVLASEEREDGSATLPIELDVIPGAVWQAELQARMPEDMRVSLFERGGEKCALVTFSGGDAAAARAAFEAALQGANEVSQEAYSTVANERKAREQASRT
jgi:hypothetical protein